MNGAMGSGETVNITVVNQLMKAVKALSPSPVRCLHVASLVAMPTGNISYHSSQPINLPTIMRNNVPGAYASSKEGTLSILILFVCSKWYLGVCGRR